MRIPFLISLDRINDPEQVAELARSPALDRDFGGTKGAISRGIARRTVSILSLDGRRLPGVAPREDVARAEAQYALRNRLAGQEPNPALVRQAAAYLQGQRSDDQMALALQTAIGRLFLPDFLADARSLADAALLNAAPREFNPLKLLRDRLTGRVAAARARLAERIGGDVVAMHGIAIAFHSFAASLSELKRLAGLPGALGNLDAREAARRALRPPETILREARVETRLAARVIPAGTLCAVGLRAAHARAIAAGEDPDQLGFMGTGWSYCPAAQWVMRVLMDAWNDTRTAAKAGPALEPESATPRFRAHLVAKRDQAETLLLQLWRLRLGVDLVLGGLALIHPVWVGSHLFGSGEASISAGFVRLWGLMLVGLVLLSLPSAVSVSKWHWPVPAGLAFRPALVLAYFALGGIWLGLFEMLFWLVLAAACYRQLVTRLQCHP